MFCSHPLLWHYLWVAPYVLLIGLAILTWRQGLRHRFPIFFVYMVFEAIGGLTLYIMNALPSFVSNGAWWHGFRVFLVLEALVKLSVVWELLSHLVVRRTDCAQLGKRMFVCAGAILFVVAILIASHALTAPYSLISQVRILDQTVYVVECGLLLFIFLFAAYFRLAWSRNGLGIALGLSISACISLASVAPLASGIFFKREYLLDFLDMGTYHVSVLIWYYFLLWRAHPEFAPTSKTPISQAEKRSPPIPIGQNLPRKWFAPPSAR